MAAKLANGRVADHLREAPAGVHAGLRRIVDVTRAFMAASLAAGADGFFFATQLADRAVLGEEDVPRVRRALRSAGRWEDCRPVRRCSFICTVSSRCWSWPIAIRRGRSPGTTGASARLWARSSAKRGRPVAGGIDEAAIVTMSPDEVAAQAADAMGENDGRGLIVAPGCVIPVATPAENIRAALRAVRVGDGD